MNHRSDRLLSRRTTFVAACAGLLLIVVVCVAVVLRSKPQITRTTFQNIRIGMTRTELHDLLGEPGSQQALLGIVNSSTSMTINFREDQARLRDSGYRDYIFESWFSPTITIMAYVDANDRVVCRYSAAGQNQTLLGRIWPKRRVILPRDE